jgi:hypothetical protein
MNSIIFNQKKLFLIDGTGALLSAFLLGVVLVRFEDTFGMPRRVLYFLSVIAGIFAVYSFMSYLLIKKNRRPYLKIIAFANLAYCCLTAGLTLYFIRELTNFGLAYFVSEVALIITLAIVELKSASKLIDYTA